MKALWLRIEAHEVDSIRLARFAEQLGVTDVTALGHYVALGGAVAEHTDDGNIAAVPDALLARWGRWSGKADKFAGAVRSTLQAESGEYGNWREEMGQLVERRERDRKRKDGGNSATIPRKPRGNSTEIPEHDDGNSTVTERNGTERYVTTPLNSESRENSNRRSGADLDPERATAPPAAAPPASFVGATAELERFLDRFYAGADEKRRADVSRQVSATLTPAGAKLRRGEHVHAGSVERLVTKLRETIAEGVKDPDKAITVLLIKLGDTSDVSAQHAADVKRDELEAEAEQRQNLGHALAWLADHRDVEAAIDRELAVIAASIDGNLGDVARRFERHARVLAAWREAGAPRGLVGAT